MKPARPAILALLALCATAAGQQLNPVYTDDSPVARETLSRVAEFIAARNESEAVRELQRLLDEQPDRLVVSEFDPDLFVSVRARVNRTLLDSPALLSLYRDAETARGSRQLAAGDFGPVERSRLLTAPGFEATLRVAQTQLEAAQFEAALLTLSQLERHPDRKDQNGRDAAAMARTISRYTPSAMPLAQRWAAESSLPPGETAPIAAPPCLTVDQTDFMKPSGPLNSEGVPPRPLWSSAIEPAPMPLEPDDAVLRVEQAAELATNLWIFPTVVGDTVYVNDGVFIAARDRFTLQPRWYVRPVSEEGSTDPWAPRRARVTSRLVEDTCTATICGHTVVATMGLAQNSDREGDAATFALDAGTGKVIWSALLPRLDAQLDGASVRGAALIDGDTVILAVRKIAQGRRIVSLYLIGLSLDNGSLRWVRPIGSAGSVPWGGREQRIHSSPALDRGIVYCTDHLGVIGAVESATGRPVWIRRDPVPAMGGAADGGSPWQWSIPLIDADSVITLAPDRSEIFRLDRATGRILAHRASASVGEPSYLLRVGDQVACVGLDTIAFLPLADIEKGAASKTPRISGIRGRVVVAGDRLLVPRPDTLATIDPANPSQAPVVSRLDHLGNILPLDSQLLVIDSANLHSYLTWSVAQKLLQDRMTAQPDDPEPAVTFTDLAYRSGHPDQIAPAADKALAAIQKAPTAEPMRQARQRADLERLEGELSVLSRPRPPLSVASFGYRLVEVREKLGTEPKAKARLAAYYKDVNERNRQAFADVLPAPVAEGQSGYVGVNVCTTCHQSERAFWDKTPHHAAYATLSKDNKQFNLECVSCHVTGYDKPGGSTVAHVGELANVQCEVCHGPGSRHVASPADKTLVSTPARTLCAASCHHPPHVHPGWSVNEAWTKIVGVGHQSRQPK